MPANPLQRRLTEERRERAWTLYCQGLPCWAIGKELGISRQAVDQLIATVRKRHPAKEMSEEEKWLEAYDTLREVGLMMRQQIAKARADGEPVPPSASKVDASPVRSPRGLDGAEQCVATARPSKLM
jgi:hypothetical protein